MVGQIADQAPIARLDQAAKPPKIDQDKAAGFDTLLQQKRQTADEPAQAQDKQPAQKQEAPKAEATEEGGEAEVPRVEQEDEIPDDAKAVLAAMMLQPQPQIQPETVTVQAGETAPEAVEAVETAPVQEAAAEMVPQAEVREETPETAQPQARAVREAPAEAAAEQPQQEAGQTQAVAQAPRAEEQQPQDDAQSQAQTGNSEQTVVETADTTTRRTRETDTDDEQAPVEAPLFQQSAVEDAVPVKVADPAPVLNPDRPLPIESEEAPQQLVEIVTTAVEDGREVSVIRIAPDELGPVQLTISREADGSVHLTMEAADPKTRSLLEKHADNVQNIMADNLRESVKVEVRKNDQAEQQDWTDGRNGRQQQEERQQRQKADEDGSHDFMQRLRLGLVEQDGDEN